MVGAAFGLKYFGKGDEVTPVFRREVSRRARHFLSGSIGRDRHCCRVRFGPSGPLSSPVKLSENIMKRFP